MSRCARRQPTRPSRSAAGLVASLCLCLFVFASEASEQTNGAVARGEQVFRAAGGCSCHTDLDNDGPWLAGGRALRTSYGTFYASNITPDTVTGIGAWTVLDFIRAMREGRSPDGVHYYPAFPYTSFMHVNDQDVRDLWAYLKAQPPVVRKNSEHDLEWTVAWRAPLGVWKWLYLDTDPRSPDPKQTPAWNRGAYLVNGPGHCAECHTPRDRWGGLEPDRWLVGAAYGADRDTAPNITPDPATGIGSWSAADIVWLLQTGFNPEGDTLQGVMAELIEHGYRHLPRADLEAIAAYLLSLPPVRNEVSAPAE